MEPTPKDLLNKAIEFLETGWTQGTNARDSKGARVIACSEYAVCWCADGALVKASHEYGLLERARVRLYVSAVTLLTDICEMVHQIDYINFNDRQPTVKPVIDLFKRAISAAPAEV